MFTSKAAVDKSTAAAVLGKWQGAVNVAWVAGDGDPCQTLSVTIAAKGKAKVAGTLADGTRVTAKGQLLVGEDWCCVPVMYSKRGVTLAFALWLPRTPSAAARPMVVGLGENAVVGKPGTLAGGTAFRIDEAAFSAMWGRTSLPYLPNGVSVSQSGTKWVVASGAKAGKVAYVKGSTEIDESKLGGNPSALKLTYKAKDGSFKGTFKAYADVNGKPKATTVNVIGVLIDGYGYGSATIKKVGGLSVTIE